jgi:hypothetical protein
MLVLFFVAVYSICSFWLLPTTEAISTAVMAAVSLFGVLGFTRSRTLTAAFGWFRLYKLQGLFVVLLTLGGLLMCGLYLQTSIAQQLLQGILIFLWLWMFSAVQTFLR